MTTTTCRLDPAALTVIAIDEHGVEHDLNATGEPCRGLADLRRFVLELKEQGLPIPDALTDELRQPRPRDDTTSARSLTKRML